MAYKRKRWGAVMDTIVGEAQRRAFRDSPPPKKMEYLSFLSFGGLVGSFILCDLVGAKPV